MSISFYNRAAFNFQKAINALLLFSKNENDPLLAILYKNIAAVYSQVGDAKRATLFAKMSLAINLDNYTPFHLEVAKDYLNLGIYYSALNESRKAFKYFNQSLDIADSIGIADDDLLMMNLYSSIGYEYESIKLYDLALDNYNKQLSKSISRNGNCLLYTSPSPRDATLSRMPSSA